MNYIFNLQTDALDALVADHDDELGNPSFKKEIMFWIQNEQGLITQEAFTNIAARYTLHSSDLWQDFQLQLKDKHASRTANFLQRVQEFSSKFQNYKYSQQAA